MRKLVLVLLVSICIINETYSQIDSCLYRNYLSITINDLIFQRFTLNYSNIIAKNLYSDFSVGFRQGVAGDQDYISNIINEALGTIYSDILLRAGIKTYAGRNVFIGLMVNYNYRYCNNMKVEDDLSETDKYYGVYYRYKNQIGGLLKIGFILGKSKHLLSEYYFGIGLRQTTVNGYFKKAYVNGIATNEKIPLTDPLNPDQFLDHSYSYLEPTFHIGFNFGIK